MVITIVNDTLESCDDHRKSVSDVSVFSNILFSDNENMIEDNNADINSKMSSTKNSRHTSINTVNELNDGNSSQYTCDNINKMNIFKNVISTLE